MHSTKGLRVSVAPPKSSQPLPGCKNLFRCSDICAHHPPPTNIWYTNIPVFLDLFNCLLKLLCICASNWLDWTGPEMPTIDFSVHCFKIVTIAVLLYFAVKTIWRKTFTFWRHFLNWWFFLGRKTEFRQMFLCSVLGFRQLLSYILRQLSGWSILEPLAPLLLSAWPKLASNKIGWNSIDSMQVWEKSIEILRFLPSLRFLFLILKICWQCPSFFSDQPRSNVVIQSFSY